MMKPHRWIAACCFVLSLVLVAGCRDDDGGPGPAPVVTLDQMWPNEDGRSWTYASFRRSWGGSLLDSTYIFTDPDSVPPAPSLADVLPLIDDPPLPDSFATAEGEFGLRFNGMRTTRAGVTAQNLEENLGDPLPGATTVAATSSAPARLLNLLAVARPDLGPRLRELGVPVPSLAAMADSFELVPTGPILLRGAAWEKTEDWIGTYGDIDARLVWQYLRKELTPGSSFTYPILPSLADDALLHVLVRRLVTVETPVGTFANALDVVYLVDYGVSAATAEGSPDPLAFFRIVAYGNVVYSPTLGPVFSYEKTLVPVGEDGVGPGFGDVAFELVGVEAGGS